MTDRLWNYLEKEFKPATADCIEIETEQGIFRIEPIYCDYDEIVDFAVFHNGYFTTAIVSPNIWFWEEIEKTLLYNII